MDHAEIDHFGTTELFQSFLRMQGFTMKALVIGGSLVIHAASCLPGTDLLTVTFNLTAETEISQNIIQDFSD